VQECIFPGWVGSQRTIFTCLPIAQIYRLECSSHNSQHRTGQDWITVTNLRRSFFWAALYLALILVLGQADYIGKPIINFASYFYVVAMISVPVTLFFPGVTRFNENPHFSLGGNLFPIVAFH